MEDIRAAFKFLRYRPKVAFVLAAVVVVFGIVLWRVSSSSVNAERVERIEAVERSSCASRDIALVLRKLAIHVVRGAPPVASMTFDQRLAHEDFKAAVPALAAAAEQLEHDACRAVAENQP